ncbi:MAG: 23S rRNA (pseudouridine(1915)-N(3))-methyltransferase RlmH [Gemmatimonadota bacterium]
MRFRVITIGRPGDEATATVIGDYERRAARYWPLDFVEVRGGRDGGRQESARRGEGDKVLAAAKDSWVVAVVEGGEIMNSRAFAAWLQTRREQARDVSFLIGGPHGLHPSVVDAAHQQLSLAPWTLPHDIARLLLAEQLYRAGTIGRGEPYHK